MKPALLIAASLCLATTAAAAAPQVTVAKVAVTPVRIAKGTHAGKTRLRVGMTITKNAPLRAHERLLIEVTCRVSPTNRTDSTIVAKLKHAAVGQPVRHTHYLFGVRPFAQAPTRCTLVLKLGHGLARTNRIISSFCYTGEKKLVAKACSNMRTPIVTGKRPRPIISLR